MKKALLLAAFLLPAQSSAAPECVSDKIHHVHGNGTLLILQSGRNYRVYYPDVVMAFRWRPDDRLSLCGKQSLNEMHEIRNESSNQVIKGELLIPARH